MLAGLFPEKWRLPGLHVMLLIASYIFYMTWKTEFALLMAISTAIDYFAARWMAHLDSSGEHEDAIRHKRTIALTISIFMNLGLLFYFKYVDFFIGSFVDLANSIFPGTFSADQRSSLLLNVILPLGISFFTFQSMSYTIDVYRRIIPAERSFLRFALYVSFFPQLVAGPIVTARDFLPQLDKFPDFNTFRMISAMRWFLLGFIKKAVIADNIAPVVDMIYATPGDYGMMWHWLGALGFWIQIYSDFSGYSDMAFGTALFLGYHLPENFMMPFLSRSITEHWRRWHVSLMRWIRDYLYIPLGGNRVSWWRHKFNAFITMFLAGVWHGASWTFALWGAIHGMLLVIESIPMERIKKRQKAGLSKPSHPVVRYGTGTLAFIYYTIINLYFATIFRAQSIGDAWLILRRMIGLDAIPEQTISADFYRPILLGALVVYTGHLAGLFLYERKTIRIRIPVWLELVTYPFLFLLISQLTADSKEAFIYFVF